MSKATVIELVLFRTNEGVNPEEFNVEMTKYNDFLIKKCEGFVSRKIGLSADGQYLDVMYWADLDSCNAAAEKAEQDAELMAFQSVMDTKIDQQSVVYQRFEVFGDTFTETDKAKVIEIVLFRTNEGVNQEDFQVEMKRWDSFLIKHEGFVSRKVGVAADEQYVGITYWTDWEVPKILGEKIDQSPEMTKLFDSNMEKIDEKTLSDEYFEIIDTLKSN